MKETEKTTVPRARRDFLKLSLLGSAAAAGAVAASRPAAAAEAEPEGSGYRETDHVRTYYQTARF